jgi:tetratricopeptide (TPR) repeat protein
LFGALAAVALRYSGLEHKVHRAIERKVSWTPDAEIVQANELMESGKLDEAAVVLNQYLATNRDSFPAWNLLRAVYWRASNIPAYREATAKLCKLHLRARESEAAWQDYEDFLNAGGESLPPTVWLELCRVPEQRQEYERAVGEYEKLADAHPSARESILAKISAARLCLKRLNRPQDALRLYEGASASTVPHLDVGRDIQIGIQQAKDVLSKSAPVSAGTPLTG